MEDDGDFSGRLDVRDRSYSACTASCRSHGGQERRLGCKRFTTFYRPIVLLLVLNSTVISSDRTENYTNRKGKRVKVAVYRLLRSDGPLFKNVIMCLLCHCPATALFWLSCHNKLHSFPLNLIDFPPCPPKEMAPFRPC